MHHIPLDPKNKWTNKLFNIFVTALITNGIPGLFLIGSTLLAFNFGSTPIGPRIVHLIDYSTKGEYTLLLSIGVLLGLLCWVISHELPNMLGVGAADLIVVQFGDDLKSKFMRRLVGSSLDQLPLASRDRIVSRVQSLVDYPIEPNKHLVELAETFTWMLRPQHSLAVDVFCLARDLCLRLCAASFFSSLVCALIFLVAVYASFVDADHAARNFDLDIASSRCAFAITSAAGALACLSLSVVAEHRRIRRLLLQFAFKPSVGSGVAQQI